jgi:hypothetical protein
MLFSLFFLFDFYGFCHAESVLQILKKFVLGVWGIPQQAWKGISLAPACNRRNPPLYALFYILIIF